MHPRHENSELHFTQDNSGPDASFRVVRILRQRYFREEATPGYGLVTHMSDFPLLLDFKDWEGSGFEHMTREELEEFGERCGKGARMWSN